MSGNRILTVVCTVAMLMSVGSASAQRTPAARRSAEPGSAIGSKLVANANENAATTVSDTLEQFRENNPGARFFGSQFYRAAEPDDEASTGMTSVYGTILSLGATPEESAWNHFNELRGALGQDIGTMIPEIKANGTALQGVMWNPQTRTHKFNVLRFNQYYQGIPVFRSGAGFLVRNQQNNPLVMSGFTVKDLTDAKISVPSVNAEAGVSRTMLGNVRKMMNAVPIERSVLETNRRRQRSRIATSEEQYVVFAGINGEFVEPELAVSFIAERGTVQTFPDYHKYFVVASVSTGEILHEETMVCHCATCMPPVDVEGTVQGRATQGLSSLECDPEVAVPLPYAEISIGGTTVNADVNGNFTIPNSESGPVTVTSRLRGTYFEVFDVSNGGATPELTQTVTPPGPANILHNPTTGNDLMTANVNTYVESNLVRDFVLRYEPDFPIIANQTGFDINTNLADTCNAFYNGVSINFFQRGGGCNNTAFSDVVHHEYGHHLINVSRNGQGQMGEGTGDTMGVLIQDDPILGQGFNQACGTGIRSANNNIQYPCSGGIHFCGQMLSGSVWDTLNELRSTEGANAIDVSAQLFLGMLIVRGELNPGQTMIGPEIPLIYVELDDDDGNIGNGTPHYDEIATGFGGHNLNPPPIDLLDFTFPNGLPETVPSNGGVAFQVQVSEVNEQPLSGTGTLHVDTGNGFEEFAMTEVSPNLYEAVFPTMECGIPVNFFVSAQSEGGQSLAPADAPDQFFTAIVSDSLEVVFSDDGETDAGWTVQGDAVDGQWDRGVPVGGGDRGDPAADGDGSGACWLTDNFDGNTDVDGGETILTSPVFSAVGLPTEAAMVSYYRFYSNDFGANPMANVFVVEISNDAGQTWVNLETVGPDGPEVSGGWIRRSFRVDEFVTPSENMRLRFIASDIGPGAVVEAGVDGIEVQMVGCGVPQTAPFVHRLLDGVAGGGSLGDVGASDDVDFQIDPTPTTVPFRQIVDMLVIGETTVDSPSTFEFHVEASVVGGPEGDVMQTISLFDENINRFVAVDTRPASGGDTVVIGAGAGDLSRFVHPFTGEITARVRWSSPEFNNSTPFFWSVDVDQAVWVIE